MKTLRVSLGVLFLGLGVGFAQVPAVPPASAGAGTATAPVRTAAELEQLVGPIALYPDALIAIILPASTAPADIVLAARHLRDSPNDRSQIEHRAWDESVKSLTSYADVLQWMDNNLDWTKQLGEAFILQPADVMQAVQRLRAKARAAGTLVDTPQQQVIAEQQVIRIVPAQPDVIYVPHYQPEIVFVDRPVYYPQPFITFGVGVRTGSWLAFDCDWHRHTIWHGNRHRHWHGHDWRRPLVPYGHASGHSRTADVRAWRPAPQPPRASFSVAWSRPVEVARPSPFGSSAHRSPSSRSNSSFTDHRGATNPPPVVNTQPRTYSGTRREVPAPPAGSTTPQGPMLQPLPTARTPMPTPVAPAPTVSNPPTRGHPNGWSRHQGSHSPGVVSNTRAPVTRSAPPTVSAQPAVIAPPVTHAAPRVHSRPPATVVAPPAVSVATPTHSAPVRTHSAPTVTPSAPVVSSAPASAPGTAAAPRSDSGADRWRGRRSEN